MAQEHNRTISDLLVSIIWFQHCYSIEEYLMVMLNKTVFFYYTYHVWMMSPCPKTVLRDVTNLSDWIVIPSIYTVKSSQYYNCSAF